MTTIEQIVQEEQNDHEEWERITVVYKLRDGQEITASVMRQVFDRVCDKDNWRSPCAAFVPAELVELVCAALEYFHGCKATLGGVQALTGKVLVESSGYAC